MTRRSVIASTFAFSAVFLAGTLEAAPFIVENGTPNAEIVISTNPTRTVRLAAQELRDAIRKISGAELPVSSQPSGNYPVKIYIGESKYTRDLGLLEKEFKDDSCRIVSGKDYLAIVGDEREQEVIQPFPENGNDVERAEAEWEKISGGLWAFIGALQKRGYNKQVDVGLSDGMGALNGVYDFIRSLGVRWYFPGEFGESPLQLPATPAGRRPLRLRRCPPETTRCPSNMPRAGIGMFCVRMGSFP